MFFHYTTKQQLEVTLDLAIFILATDHVLFTIINCLEWEAVTTATSYILS